MYIKESAHDDNHNKNYVGCVWFSCCVNVFFETNERQCDNNYYIVL